MASNGIDKKAEYGTCRVCQRRRKTDDKLKAVGEVHHGFATGYIWECVDVSDCQSEALKRLKGNGDGVRQGRIRRALFEGRFTQYKILG